MPSTSSDYKVLKEALLINVKVNKNSSTIDRSLRINPPEPKLYC